MSGKRVSSEVSGLDGLPPTQRWKAEDEVLPDKTVRDAVHAHILIICARKLQFVNFGDGEGVGEHFYLTVTEGSRDPVWIPRSKFNKQSLSLPDGVVAMFEYVLSHF